MKKIEIDKLIGSYLYEVELKTIVDGKVSRPRVIPVGEEFPEIKVEFPRHLREQFPIGTRFSATVKICQKTMGGKPKGPPYLRATRISVIEESISDGGLLARVREGSISGLAYDYFNGKGV